MKILTRYIGGNVIAASIFGLLALLSLFAFFDVLSELTDIGRGGYSFSDVLVVVALKLPRHAFELMPLAAFPGERNWGYDGTYLFALHGAYGSYADLQAFIEAAHDLGIAVILDVVYNHFGPEGNYSWAYAPYTKQADTPWGAAINFDGGHSEGIRAFYLANTRYWLQEVGFDGFRMDAVSLIFDESPRHILREITDLARTIGADEGREVLTYIDGESGTAGWAKVVDERGLVAMARLLREYHDAVRGFRPTAGNVEIGEFQFIHGLTPEIYTKL